MTPKEHLKLGLRPCLVYDSRQGRHVALFHRWVDESKMNSNKAINYNSQIDDHLKTYALVEICETGTVWYCKPQDIIFIGDASFLKYRNEEIENLKEFYKYGGNEK